MKLVKSVKKAVHKLLYKISNRFYFWCKANNPESEKMKCIYVSENYYEKMIHLIENHSISQLEQRNEIAMLKKENERLFEIINERRLIEESMMFNLNGAVCKAKGGRL